MGGAFTAVSDDAYAVYWNPAGLAQVTRQSIALNHVEFIEKVNSQFASYVLPVNKLNGSLGVGLTYVDLGTVDKTTDVELERQRGFGNSESNFIRGHVIVGTSGGRSIGVGRQF